jgi:hypothetical protein
MRDFRSITSSPIEPLKQFEPSGWNFHSEPVPSKFEKNCWPVATLALAPVRHGIRVFATA